MSLQVGDACPKFVGKLQDGTEINISDYIGKKNLVIYFYPKDFTPGCTTEACAFRDNYEAFQELNCEVFGVSSDSKKSHQKFAEKHQLPYPLISDKNKTIKKAFGVPASLFGLIPGRVTYIIDKKGIVRGIYNSQSNPWGHIEAGLKLVRELNEQEN